jgi:hypothetical protein
VIHFLLTDPFMTHYLCFLGGFVVGAFGILISQAVQPVQ